MIRRATQADADTILRMYDHSRSMMRAAGNMQQWVGYPTMDDVLADIAQHASYIITRHGQAIGTFAIVEGVEPTYGYIDHGRWIDDTSAYATMHRMACMPNYHGIARDAFGYAKRRYNHLRVDTHPDNHAMRHIAAREGFVHCGTIYMPDGGARLAYEWWRWDEVPTELQHYINRYVLPRYDHFDAAHSRQHALRVVARTMILCRHDVDTAAYDHTIGTPNRTAMLAYTAAAMHDVGLAAGREAHHTQSAAIIRSSAALRRYFGSADIETIAEAAEDHRASVGGMPRSRVGLWVAEADRDIEPLRIIRRTIEYGMAHYPTLSRQQHYNRMLQHLNDKYSASGYLKLLLPNSPNATPLAELRAIIADEERLATIFNTLFDSLQCTQPC